MRDLNLAVPARDEREIEVIAFGLPCRAGAQLAVDATIRSPLSACGAPHARAASEDAVAANSARQDKVAKYPEFSNSPRCDLVVLALETGGRFSDEAYRFVEELAFAKAHEAPPVLRKTARLSWQRRWMRILACAAARAGCDAVLLPAESVLPKVECRPMPTWHDVACER